MQVAIISTSRKKERKKEREREKKDVLTYRHGCAHLGAGRLQM